VLYTFLKILKTKFCRAVYCLFWTWFQNDQLNGISMAFGYSLRDTDFGV